MKKHLPTFLFILLPLLLSCSPSRLSSPAPRESKTLPVQLYVQSWDASRIYFYCGAGRSPIQRVSVTPFQEISFKLRRNYPCTYWQIEVRDISGRRHRTEPFTLPGNEPLRIEVGSRSSMIFFWRVFR